MDLAKGARAVWEENPDTLILSLQEIIAFLAVDETAPDWLRRIAAGLPQGLRHIEAFRDPSPSRRWGDRQGA